MRATVIAYLAALGAMLALDGIWLTFAAERLYRPELGESLAPSFSPAPAAAFYLIYVAGLIALAVLPGEGLAARGATAAAARGAVYGFCAYATYDLTNQATLRHWSTVVTLADMAWGAALSAAVAFVAALVYARLSPGTAAAAARIR